VNGYLGGTSIIDVSASQTCVALLKLNILNSFGFQFLNYGEKINDLGNFNEIMVKCTTDTKSYVFNFILSCNYNLTSSK
jgi:hypothetical protein